MSQVLGQVLVAQGVLSEADLAHALQLQAERGTSLGKTLVDLNMADEYQIVRAVATQVGIPYVGVQPGEVDPMAAGLLPRDVAREIVALPVQFLEGNTLLVALADPGNTDALGRVQQVTGLQARPALAVRADLLQAIEHLADASPAAAEAAAAAFAEPAAPSTEGFQSGSWMEGAPPGVAAGAPASAPASAPAAPESMEPANLLEYEQETGFDLDLALAELVKRGGSDLHLTAGIPPAIRVHGELEHLEGFSELHPDALRKTIYSILTQKQRETFENNLELDTSYQLPGLGRFRVNVFQQRGAIGSVMRLIPFEIKPLEELGIPPQVANFCYMPRGLVLVTGPTGSGKSTTLASMIDIINREKAVHIMTVEDPIEFLHHHKRSVVNQRELGQDTHSFAEALKHVLRQDPDVILVGEMRDLETIQLAITAAETGHLVFGTLHTQDAPQTIDRVIDVFPPHQQEQIRVMLSTALNGVVTQTLLKRADGQGRVVATEIMVATPAIKNLIREGKTHQMYSSLQAGKQHGMVSMDQSLADLVNRGIVTYNHALERCQNVGDFNRLVGRA